MYVGRDTNTYDSITNINEYSIGLQRKKQEVLINDSWKKNKNTYKDYQNRWCSTKVIIYIQTKELKWNTNILQYKAYLGNTNLPSLTYFDNIRPS